MSINTHYKTTRNSIVAFTQKFIPVQKEGEPAPVFPPIIGTGFVVREDGVIATNAHVVDAFNKVFRPSDLPEDEWPIQAMLFKITDKGLLEIPLEVIGVLKISKIEHGESYYGPKEGPDIAFVHVKARGLPELTIDNDTVLEEGMSVATAGFPMGTDALTAPGWLHQLTPTLQQGIISAVLPFACSTPHALSINIMTQGGASGSPVFLCETGKVIGVLYAGLHDIDVTLKGKDIFRVPTNISYVVPSHYIYNSMKGLLNQSELKLPDDAQSIDEMIDNSEHRNVFKEGKAWETREINPEVEKTRIKEFSKIGK